MSFLRLVILKGAELKFAITIAALLLCGSAMAQSSKIIIGGVDQRIPPLENQIMTQQFAEKAAQAARVAALLALEKEDSKTLSDTLAATKAWLDQSWKEMEYWRAYAGFGGTP